MIRGQISRECRRRGDLYENKMFRNCARLYPGEHPSDVVRYLRLGEKMTIKAIAEMLDVSRETVRYWSPSDCEGLIVITPDEHRRRSRWAHVLIAFRNQPRKSMNQQRKK